MTREGLLRALREASLQPRAARIGTVNGEARAHSCPRHLPEAISQPPRGVDLSAGGEGLSSRGRAASCDADHADDDGGGSAHSRRTRFLSTLATQRGQLRYRASSAVPPAAPPPPRIAESGAAADDDDGSTFNPYSAHHHHHRPVAQQSHSYEPCRHANSDLHVHGEGARGDHDADAAAVAFSTSSVRLFQGLRFAAAACDTGILASSPRQRGLADSVPISSTSVARHSPPSQWPPGAGGLLSRSDERNACDQNP